MTRRLASLLAGLLLALALSGCLAGDADVFGPGDDGGTATGTNEAGNGLALAMKAVPALGEVGTEVAFTLKAVDAADGVAWTLDFGDGSKPHAGKGLPADVGHTYTKAGAFVALFTVEDGLGVSKATLTVEMTPSHHSSSSSSTSTSTSPTPSPSSGGGGAPPETSTSTS
jgi:hypothetical protein